MIAFHGKPEIKAEYLARVKAHAAADEIQHGIYWKNGKGCAVGCTIHSSNHVAYETELGIPRILARLEDCLFEGMANGDSKKFPARFLSAIPVGADLSMVWPRFALWLLEDPTHGVLRFAKKNTPQWIAIHRVANLYRELEDWDKRDKGAFREAYDDAYAAYADAYASASAASADAYAADAYAAAASASASAAAAAYAAAASASAASADAASADAYAYAKAYKAQADKLIKLLEAA